MRKFQPIMVVLWLASFEIARSRFVAQYELVSDHEQGNTARDGVNGPLRNCRSNVLSSPADPSGTIAVPRSSRYLGGQQISISQFTAAEQHVFVKPRANSRIVAETVLDPVRIPIAVK